jgi:hypothetical protein
LLLIAGAALLWNPNPFAQTFALLALVWGAGGLALGAARLWRKRREIRALQAQAAAQQAKRTARRDRERQESAQRAEERERAERQKEQERERQEEQERRAQAEARALLEARKRKDRLVEREAARLKTLHASELCAETRNLLSRTPNIALQEAQSSGKTYWIAALGEERVLIACLTESRPLSLAHLEAWETIRRGCEAQRACLIGLNGFAPEAARAVTSLPFILADPYLLAQWMTTPPSADAEGVFIFAPLPGLR